MKMYFAYLVKSFEKIFGNIIANLKIVKNIDRILAYLCEDFDLQKEFEGLRDRKYDIPLYRSLWAIMFSREVVQRFTFEDVRRLFRAYLYVRKYFRRVANYRGTACKIVYQKRKKLDSDFFEMISNVLNKEKAAYSLNLRLLNGE